MRNRSRPYVDAVVLVATLAAAGLIVVSTTLSRAQLSGIQFEVHDPFPQDVGVDFSAQPFVLADVNKDGLADLVAVNADGEKVLVRLSNGDGTFEEPPRELDVIVDEIGAEPAAVAVGDVGSPFLSDQEGDIDGNVDIVVATLDDGFVIFTGSGDGNFELRADVIDPVAEFRGIALGDFDEDSRLDIVGMDPIGDIYLLPNEQGAFNGDDPVLIELDGVDGDLVDVDVGDFDDDGSLDVVTLSNDPRVIFLILGDGGGGLDEDVQSQSSVSDDVETDQDPVALEAADLDGDDVSDVVVANSGVFGDLTLLVRRAPALRTSESFTGPFGATGLAIGRFDDNDSPDAVTSNSDGDVFLSPDNGGAGGFVNPEGVPRTGAGFAVATGNFAGDDLDDFVVLNLATNEFRAAVNQTNNPDFTPPPVTPSVPVGATSTPGGPTGTPTATRPTDTPTPTATPTAIPTVPLSRCELEISMPGAAPAPLALGSGDFNRDARPDVVAVDGRNGNLLVFLLDPSQIPMVSEGCVHTLEPLIVDVPGNAGAVAVGSLNALQDTHLDVAVAGDAGVSVAFGNGAGGFSSSLVLSLTQQEQPRAIAVGDVDRDGRQDIVVAIPEANELRVLYGRGDRTFDAPLAVPVPSGSGKPSFVLIADLNQDTFPDLAAASEEGRAVAVTFRSASDGRMFDLENQVVVDLTGAPTSMSAADFNRDGLADLAVAIRATDGSGSFVVLIATRGEGGAIGFEVSNPAATGRRPSALGTSDFDLDAAQDVVVTNFIDNTATFFFGQAAGFFDSKDPVGTNEGPSALVIADFDLDGRPDVITADRDAGTLTLLRSSVPPSTPTATATGTATQTGTITRTPTQSGTPTATGSETPTPEGSPTMTGSRTPTPSRTKTLKPGIFELSGNGCAVTSGGGSADGGNALFLWALVLLGFVWRSRTRDGGRPE